MKGGFKSCVKELVGALNAECRLHYPHVNITLCPSVLSEM